MALHRTARMAAHLQPSPASSGDPLSLSNALKSKGLVQY
eukprot:COSAG03_NODE_12650_length_537_cov_1.728311_1_plen_38_part_01